MRSQPECGEDAEWLHTQRDEQRLGRPGPLRRTEQVAHLRTRNGDHEVDFIVEGDQGIVAFEAKLSASITDSDVKHLAWLRERLGDDLLDAVVLTTSPEAYRRTDGIAVVPLALLGA